MRKGPEEETAIVLQNGTVFIDGRLKCADVAFENGVITQISEPGTIHTEAVMDVDGHFVLPGFVDIHSHGALGHDFCDAGPAGLEALLAYYGNIGVTSVLLTTMSLSELALLQTIEAAAPLFEQDSYGAVLRGVYLEGPFLNPKKAGAQDPRQMVAPDIELFERLQTAANAHIRIVSVAPEMPGGLAFIQQAAKSCTVSLAHTAANDEEARCAFNAGGSHVTHLLNAMEPFASRAPGVLAAACERAEHVEVISDGLHLHPAVVKALFRWFGAGRICLISDSMRATGMPDGIYDLGGQQVAVCGGRASLAGEPKTIAGSVVSLPDMCRRAIQFGVPFEHAILASTINNARAAKIDHLVGSIAPGKRSDFLVWDRHYATKAVVCGGNLSYKHNILS